MSDTKQPKPKIFDRYSLLERNAADKENRTDCSLALSGSATGPHVAKGVCIVCGSALVLSFWRGHPDHRKVHCNDCGSEVTEWMHKKKQPNAAHQPEPA